MTLDDITGYAEQGSAPHQIYLSRLHMVGAGVERDVDRAMAWLKRAIDQDDPTAYAERAVVLAQGYGGVMDRAQAWDDLRKAFDLGDAGAGRQLGALAAAMGDEESALALLQDAAQVEDEPAKLLLAELLHERGDGDAAYWYHSIKDNPLAAARIKSRNIQPGELQNETRPLADNVLSIFDGFDPFAPLPAQQQDRHDEPAIYVKKKAIAPALCRYVMAAGAGFIRQSDVVDPDTGKSKVDPYHTGFLHQFSMGYCDFTVGVFDHHIAAQTGTRPQQGEPLTMLVYEPGQQYKPHWDHLVDTMDESFGRLGRSGNRRMTALVTLDDGFSGGATRFTRLNIDVRLACGDMLVFENSEADGTRYDDSMHAGLPVDSGMKWLASKWIRQKDFAH